MRRVSAGLLTALSGLILALGGCVTGAKGSARRVCYDSGYQPGTQQFSDCWRGIARRDNAEAVNGLLGATAVYGVMQSSRPSAPGGLPVQGHTYTLTSERFANTGDKMCAYQNGTVLNVGNRNCAAAITAP